MSGPVDWEQREVSLLLLDTIQEIAALPVDKRLQFARLFMEMVELWNDEE